MNNDAIQFLVDGGAHLRKLYEMIESRTVQMTGQGAGKVRYYKYQQGDINNKGDFVEVTAEDIKTAVGRWLATYEKKGLIACQTVYKSLQEQAEKEGGHIHFFRGSRETIPYLVFNSHIRWLNDHSGGPQFHIGKALLVDLPELWGHVISHLKGALYSVA